ncbi:FAD/NAD(P)-binding domain-containing protein [Periconia macrospinosa]|uniref:FAD/NAD(P)-binding domain-containing protein n=1 Tax=Periconia macrospinosa TaxID=97972 RepID=A0A2V1CXS1_9PLEO|nr:FAD/NAD(P)-binding domain-containing protein [Periconia macrospinosa]
MTVAGIENSGQKAYGSAPTGHLEMKCFPTSKKYDSHRPVKAIIVGAGIGGTTAALLLSRKVKNITIDVYDRFANIVRYLGLSSQCVSDEVKREEHGHPISTQASPVMYAYQLSFAPNTQWFEYYPKDSEIQKCHQDTVKSFGLFDRFHLQHEVLRATWLEHEHLWSYHVRDLKNNSHTHSADFLVSSQGQINVPNLPAIKGHGTKFQGEVIHTARWRPEVELTGKRVAGIGNGASGQQLVPNILPQVANIDHYVRTKTWMTATFARDLYEVTADVPGGPKFTKEELNLFQSDPKAYLEFRRKLELRLHHPPGTDVLGSEANQILRRTIIEIMLHRIRGDEQLLARILPDYAPGCKRLTPAPGYLEALVGPKVDYVTDPIVRVDGTGIWTSDKVHREVDVIIAARGNARGGTIPLQIEITSTFIAKAIRKVQSQLYSALHPSENVAPDFNNIVAGHFENKVAMDKCNTWFRQAPGRSRVLVTWPGSYHHRASILRDPQ